MACIRPPKGARLGNEGVMGDTLCNVKSADFLQSAEGHEQYKTEMGRWYEERRETPLYCLVERVDPALPQGIETMEVIKEKSKKLNKEVFGHPAHVTR